MATKTAPLGSSVSTPVDNTTRRVVVLPGAPSTDFILNAKCRIVNVGTRISMNAADLPGQPAGTFTWTTTSTKIRLVNATGPTLAVEALAKPGAGRDSEIITVTRKGPDGKTTSKTVKLTVAQLTFHEAKTQRYGFDDFDTPAKGTDDHLCVKNDDHTFVAVKILGGAVGSDFDFVCANPICSADPAPATAAFDLKLTAKKSAKLSTVLSAKVKCPVAAVFGQINVHVYAERVVKVLVAKVADAKSAKTALSAPAVDYAAHQKFANDKLKEGVVRYQMRNFNSNKVVNVAYDKDSNGALSYDINAGGGPEFQAISKAVPGKPGEIRVAIIKSMRSFYYLSAKAVKGTKTLTVRGSNIFQSEMPLGSGTTLETVEVISNVANVATLKAPLKFDHPVGTKLEFPAAGWGSDPILIMEGSAGVDVTKWTILHEVGHTALNLMDIVDPKDFMHFQQGSLGYRLRFCPRTSKYKTGVKENQWETIPRALAVESKP